jgi:hypothetical protein
MTCSASTRLLELGAAGRLLVAGELDDVLPLDDGGDADFAAGVSRKKCSPL